MTLIVPPGGFSGFAQMTPASQRALSTTSTPRRSVRRKRSGKSTKARTRKTGARKLKFGSAAWRRKYGAKAKRAAAKARKARK